MAIIPPWQKTKTFCLFKEPLNKSAAALGRFIQSFPKTKMMRTAAFSFETIDKDDSPRYN